MCGHFRLGQVPKDPKILVLAPIAGMSLPFTTEFHCYNKNSEKMWRTILNVLKNVQNDLKCDTSIYFFLILILLLEIFLI